MYTEKTKENSPNCLQPDILTCHHCPIAYPRVVLSDGPLLQRQYSTLVTQTNGLDLIRRLLDDHNVLVDGRWTLVLHETLGLIRGIFNGNNFLLDFDILSSGGIAAEENTPNEDSNVADDHSQKAGGDSDHNTDEDWDNHMHDDTLEEACKSTMSVVMAVWAVRSIGMFSVGVRVIVVRTVVGTLGPVRGWNNLKSWSRFGATSL